MSKPVEAAHLMNKAQRACSSARLLLDAGDIDGACNRAYYAMFDAARAVLLVAAPQGSTDIGRTHNGLIAAFSLRLVKPGTVDIAWGRALNRAEEVRLIADYKGESVDLADAAETVGTAERFVAAMMSQFPA